MVRRRGGAPIWPRGRRGAASRDPHRHVPNVPSAFFLLAHIYNEERFLSDSDNDSRFPSQEIQILRATLKEGARAIVTGKLNEYRGEPEVLVDYARLIKAPFEEAIFAEYVARVHDPAHPIDPGFTVPEDPAAFACVIVGEGPPGGVPAGGGHAAAPRAPAPAPLARTPHPAGWMGYPGALATAQAPPHAVPAAPLHSAARPRPHATAGPPHAAAAGPSGGPRAPLQGPPPEAARHRPGVALSAYDILFSRGGGAGPRPYAAPTPTPYPTHPGPAASQVSLAVGAPASAGPPVDPAEERRRRMQKIREDYERSLRGET